MKSKNIAFLLVTLLLLFLRDSHSETTRQAPTKKVSINKCCRVGDFLNSDGKCEIGIGNSNSWAPKVFLPKKKGLYEKTGSLPPFMAINEEIKPSCNSPELFKSVDVLIIGNGSLFLKNKHVTINNNFCVDQEFSLVCRFDKDSVPDNMTIIKLTKCCGPNEIYASSSCVALNNTDPLFNRNILNYDSSVGSLNTNFDFDYKFPDCGDSNSNEFAIAGLFLTSNYDTSSGSVKTESGKMFDREQYCLDHVVTDRYEGVKIFTCSGHYGTAPPILTQHQDDTRFAIYSIGLLISVLFLIATLAVGFLLLSNHHMLHWRCQTNYVICLLIGDLLLAITQISGTNLHGPSCIIIAHLMHFFFLATFFWLNTMCVNIWITFR